MTLRDLYQAVGKRTRKPSERKAQVQEFLKGIENELVALVRELKAKGELDLRKVNKAVNAMAVLKGLRKELKRPDGKKFYRGLQVKLSDLEGFLKGKGLI